MMENPFDFQKAPLERVRLLQRKGLAFSLSEGYYC